MKEMFEVEFSTNTEFWVRVEAESHEEACELVESFSPDVNWDDVNINAMGYDGLVVVKEDDEDI
jgi:hypothetical protein